MIKAHKLILAREVRELREVLGRLRWRRDRLRLVTGMRHKLREFFAEQEKRVLDALSGRMSEIISDVRVFQHKWNIELKEYAQANEMDDMLDWLLLMLMAEGDETEIMMTEVWPFISEALVIGGRHHIERINLMTGFDIKHELAEAFLRDYQTSIVESFHGVTQTTTQLIRDKLADCVHEGKGIQGMMDRIKNDVFKSKNDWRAEMTARSEVGRAYNMAGLEADMEVGVTGENLEGCDSDCEICGPIMAGNPWPIEEAMSRQDELHPNCKGDWVPDIDKNWQPKIYVGESSSEGFS